MMMGMNDDDDDHDEDENDDADDDDVSLFCKDFGLVKAFGWQVGARRVQNGGLGSVATSVDNFPELCAAKVIVLEVMFGVFETSFMICRKHVFGLKIMIFVASMFYLSESNTFEGRGRFDGPHRPATAQERVKIAC